MDLFEALHTTRAIRRFTDEPVTDDEILTCIRAAVQAPNGGNIQPWQFLVVTDSEVKRQIGAVYLRAFNRYEPAALKLAPQARTEGEAAAADRNRRSARFLAEHIGEAPAMVLVLMPNIPWGLRDDEGDMDVGPLAGSVYPAVQNLMLAARGLGIGATLTTVFRIFQEDIRQICGVSDRYEIAALVPLGRPRGKFGVAPRRAAEQVTHWNSFGNRRPNPTG
jgi:nitroreductase